MITIVNTSPADIAWGTVTIPNSSSLPITNNGITTGDHVLTFEQFSINTNLIEIGNKIEVIDDARTLFKDEAIVWIEKFYNNPMSEFDSSTGTGDMKKDDYDFRRDGSVDKAETVTFKTNNTGALQNILIGADTPIILDDVIGVHIGNGIAVIKGVAKLNVKNVSGHNMTGSVPLAPGVSVYKYDNGASIIGCVKSGIPGVRIETESEFFVGVVAGTYNIDNGEILVVDVIIDIHRDSIYNPENEGKWLREKGSNGAVSWTEKINGGTF